MPGPQGRWQLPPVPLAVLASQQTPAQQQILARPWLPPRAQTRLRVPGAAADVSAGAGAAGGEGAFVRRTRREQQNNGNNGISHANVLQHRDKLLRPIRAIFSRAAPRHTPARRMTMCRERSHRSQVNYTIGRFRRYGQITRSTHHEGCARGTSRHGRRDADGRVLLRPCSLSALRRQ